ncbi:MAG: hypothetical protein QJT81_17075 [Candidatus Thiothrix putei]|uniref:Uncharacterized protein n=1 Tax=Candidatus Thiothrix putei TaxID=3080811 RepID=A0AA95KN98_9GAMM|nr:MAG: hypothetical protein QJT81_17075 [Candidatus Thiothrix putei]
MKCLLSCVYYMDMRGNVMTIGLLSGLFGSNKSAPQPVSSCGCSGNSGSKNESSKSQSFGSGLLDLKGGLLGAKSNLIGNLLGGISGVSTGGSQGGSSCGSYGSQGGSSCGGYGGSAGSSSSNGLGSAAGGLASGVHQFAEKAISATGLGSAFAPIDGCEQKCGVL